MTDILILQERIKNSILVGESDFREFKSALEGRPDSKKPRLAKKICDDIAEALVAFANTDGGEIIIGVEDDTTITGVPHNDEDIEMMLNSPKTHVYEGQELPMVYKLKAVIEGKIVLFFQVDKGSSEIYQLRDGRVMRRNEKRQTVPANVKKLQFDQQEIKSREYDRQFVDGAIVADLDISLLQSLADSYLKGYTVERYLQHLGLAQYAANGLRLTRAAVLLFAKDIQRWHPRCQVRFIKIAGTELLSGEKYNVISDEFVQGNIHELIFKSWESMRPYLAFRTEFGANAQFEQKFIYPEDACKEAILNAIAHRDYSNSNGIEVHIFNDRMEIKSPGALLSTLTIQDLEALDNRHESRNAKIAYTLKVSKLMREMGEGMKRIFMLMQQNELQKPKLYSNTVWFTVTLFNKSVFSPIQEEFLRLFSDFELSAIQKRILIAGMNDKELSPADIYSAMNTNDRDTYDKEVTYLRKFNLLKQIRTNPEALMLSQKNKIDKQKIGRFKVVIPRK
ncbi:MAG: putative DNA binding domain-containing protein [Bacteroidia bacterium]|jgi:ATP-dependent DNA helicase RecG|nr:putative DNA binding domain-containing protein [Bacteroidia bacterium]